MTESTQPTTLGRYQLIRELGRGAMGRVYLAYDPHLNRQAAIKVILESGHSNAYFWKAFQREAKLIGSLRHPNILTVYDFGSDNGHSYLVMEYVDGGLTLAHALKDGPFIPEDVCHVLDQLAAALTHAHEAGVVHRDVKPANVLVNRSTHVYLSDFGLAKAIEDARGSTGGPGSLTMGSVGTPAYMSPEQIRGITTIDHRSDLYALGATAFELLTGEPPYRGHLDQILYSHCNAPVPSAHERNPELPVTVDAVLERALAKPPDDRYDSAVEFAAALREALADVLPEAPAHLAQGRTVAPPRPGSQPRPASRPAAGASLVTRASKPPVATGPSRPTTGSNSTQSGRLARLTWRWWAIGVAALVPLLAAALMLWWTFASSPATTAADSSAILAPYGKPWTDGQVLPPSPGFPMRMYVPPAGAQWPPPWLPPGAPHPPPGLPWPGPGTLGPKPGGPPPR